MGIGISFNTDNDAFGHGRQDAEVSRILRQLADKIETTGAREGVIRDANGNTIGQFKYTRTWHPTN